MPELPDVERDRQVLVEHAVGQRAVGVEVLDAGVIRGRPVAEFVDLVRDRRFQAPERRGKWLLAPTDGSTLLFHFGMTGTLEWRPLDADPGRFARVVFEFGSGQLVYRDQRKLRGIWLAEDAPSIAAVIGQQGPDALGLSASELTSRLQGHRGSLKAELMDQHVVAGLGNMLSDEVLWRARIHPAVRFGDLDAPRRRALSSSLQHVLRASVKAGEIPRSSSWLSAQRASPDPLCPRGHGPLRTSRIGGRTSYWCPRCQPPP
jgi:formamidopyrimidine-DNA glycosylase